MTSDPSPRPRPWPLRQGLHPLITKLEHGTSLTEADRVLLSGITAQSRVIGPHCDLIREGERPENVFLITAGLACRYKVLSNGSRQILALLLSGDLCDLNVALLGAMDHSIGTLSPCLVAEVSRATVAELSTNHPRILQGLLWSTLVDLATCREWLLSLGQRPADQRIAHLFCELLLRLQLVGCADGNSFDLPLTQGELGDVLGISNVHVNRVLQDLRKRNLIVFRGGRLEILDVEALQLACDFNPNYRHLTPRQARE
ncbi:Crp/Fnr family transcriptional regulator [Methylobacterium nigriterrae]|uniref:Crp/Fnr family transcriptional regulator n=1 Tax=Methylobacterium nigriterrae TaxID=3127512 RepID=UPI003013AAE6